MTQTAITQQITPHPRLRKSHRITQIDVIKGLAILSVIWSHTYAPSFENFRDLGFYANFIFFFFSGTFFKTRSLSVASVYWILKKSIVPFLFFYLISIPIAIIFDYWDYRSISHFEIKRILEIFTVSSTGDYLSINRPLWFLLALCNIQLISCIITHLPRPAIAIFAAICIPFRHNILTTPTPFMINYAIYWLPIFLIGWLSGRFLMKKIDSLSIGSLLLYNAVIAAYIYISQFITPNPQIISQILVMCSDISIVLFILLITAAISRYLSLNFLSFLGVNSIILFGCHMWFLTPLQRITGKVLISTDPSIGLCIAMIASLLIIPLIHLLNKYTPFFIGKIKNNE